MLFSIGFLLNFLIGGVTGVMLASAPIDFQLSRLVLPRVALPLHDDGRLGVRHLRRDLLLVAEGVRVPLVEAARPRRVRPDVRGVQPHVLAPVRAWGCAACRGASSTTRRGLGWETPNLVSSLGVGRALDRRAGVPHRRAHDRGVAAPPPATTRGVATRWSGPPSSPPPEHNFSSLPRIRSERPAFDLHHPTEPTKPDAAEPRRPHEVRAAVPRGAYAAFGLGLGTIY